ncbi:hypothetical protein L596_021498 [Steinernema carpocapsae]|uniref:Uncharacterized protein n=1 Tax=Steinernema carpocapsae TaxID=34508 RepID=A0A4U5MJA2_STECR|nr:hypothetical protein L596_021498 [Steinernema carpocapsae]
MDAIPYTYCEAVLGLFLESKSRPTKSDITDEHVRLLPSKISFGKINLGQIHDDFVYRCCDENEYHIFSDPDFFPRFIRINQITFNHMARPLSVPLREQVISKTDLTRKLLNPMLYLLSDPAEIFMIKSASFTMPELLEPILKCPKTSHLTMDYYGLNSKRLLEFEMRKAPLTKLHLCIHWAQI